ncbi:hypothetical protein [Paucilactobacillus wasatchensis]|uniref:Uncharacterized protein n=1 Tax=Paucilactobacillus wasatchensis TaxID=1335616 RepID=A0A0D0Y7B1_9LACO|nr:hypothetical protein [Paucilactobacillus wasatchensis]KIS04143.1 hypothetical protein WDC_0206 [Paucilactobacillus wasatchensis]
MTREEIIQQLTQTVKSMRRLRMIQAFFDFAMIYGVIRILMSGSMVTMFNATFTQNNAMTVVFLISLIDLCFAFIRRNHRRDGMNLIAGLTGQLNDQEARLVQLLHRF